MAKITITFDDNSSLSFSTEALLSKDGIAHKLSQFLSAPVAAVADEVVAPAAEVVAEAAPVEASAEASVEVAADSAN